MHVCVPMGFPHGSAVTNSPAMQELHTNTENIFIILMKQAPKFITYKAEWYEIVIFID